MSLKSDSSRSALPEHNLFPGPAGLLRTPIKVGGNFDVSVGSSVNENKVSRKLKFKKAFKSKTRKRFPMVKIPLSSNNQVEQVEMEVETQIFIDDDDGHLNFDIGDNIENYDLLGFLGKGSFGRVLKARNLDTCKIIALKIARSTKECQESARNEILILNKLKKIDPEGKNLWIQMLDNFEFQDHVCIAFEKLGDSLYAFLRENKFQPYQLSHIRHIAYQICHSVKALHDIMMIHTDLKPENICLVSSDFTYGIRATRQQTYRKPISTNIGLIDFGSTVEFFDDKDIMIQTRYYRAPEVLFGLYWNEAVDVWSIGCILFELYTGECLFAASDDDEHFHVMQEVLGPVPEFYSRTKLGEKNLLSCGRKKKSKKPLRKYMQMSAKEHQDLFDLLEKMLEYDHKERIPLEDALKHPFFLLLSDDLKFKH